MTGSETKSKRFSASRARAVVKAQRWAMKHRPKPPPPRRRPVGTVLAVTLGGLVAGGLLGALLERGGVSHGVFDSGAEIVRSGPEGGTESAWTVPLEPPRHPVTAGLDDDLLTPGAGPEGRKGFSYEEPLSPAEAASGPSDSEIEAMVEQAGLGRLVAPDETPPAVPLWEQNAVQVADVSGRPMIALVIDDLGVNWRTTPLAINLPGPLTLSFMTYAKSLKTLTSRARARGHELMLHVPMEPRDPTWDPGPNALTSDLTQEELTRRLDWALNRFEGYVGINNHMGSKFTGSLLGMAQVLAELKSRGLLFLDSVTSGSSVGTGLARRMGVAHAARDIFIDNEPENPEAIRRQLAKLEDIARRRGRAVGIGHPHDATLKVLAEWLPEIERRGFVLVPLSAIVRQNVKLAAKVSSN